MKIEFITLRLNFLLFLLFTCSNFLWVFFLKLSSEDYSKNQTFQFFLLTVLLLFAKTSSIYIGRTIAIFFFKFGFFFRFIFSRLLRVFILHLRRWISFTLFLCSCLVVFNSIFCNISIWVFKNCFSFFIISYLTGFLVFSKKSTVLIIFRFSSFFLKCSLAKSFIILM